MPGPTQKIFEALPVSGGCRTVPALARATGIDRREVSKICIRLRRRGLIERVRTGCYRLTEAGVAARDAGKKITSGPAGPFTGRRAGKADALRVKVWRALRMLKKATVPEMLTLAGVDDGRAANNAQQYLRRLRLAGYVAVTPVREPGTAPTSPGFARYLLLRDTGPEAPVYSTVKRSIYDPNTGEAVDLAPRLGEARIAPGLAAAGADGGRR